MGKNKEPEQSNSGFNLIVNGTKMTGNIESENNFRIDGFIKGDIIVNGKLIVGETGEINGNIKCLTAEINGKVNGKIIVSDLLSLKSTAHVTGEIIIGKLSIEPNAYFNGTCKMGDEILTKQSNE
ncbi:MAG: polymer-forming cytoskeletal protein [Bacteroidales bacterium]|nr:polymer-forming cytoskeletal protein [Bacteroidales bacterium]